MKVGDVVRINMFDIKNPSYRHNFQQGEIVRIVGEYDDGVFEVEGKWGNSVILQDVHPRDLEVIEC